MKAPVRLVAYGAGLVVAFGAAFGLAGVAVPDSVVTAWAQSSESGTHGNGHGGPAKKSATEVANGVSASAGGYVLSPVKAPDGTDAAGTLSFRVLDETGASKVDIVGHSQGGLLARQYIKFNGGASKVQKLITLGATNHGTTLDGIGTLGRAINNLGIDILGVAKLPVGVSGIQQVVGSDVVNAVNAGGDTVPGIDYTIIRTTYDEVTTPSESTFLTAGPGATVKNITLQDGCPIDLSDHLSMSYSTRAISIIKNALNPASPVVSSARTSR